VTCEKNQWPRIFSSLHTRTLVCKNFPRRRSRRQITTHDGLGHHQSFCFRLPPLMLLILVLILSTRHLVVAVEGFRVVDPLPSSLQHRRQQQHDPSWHRRRRPRPGHVRGNGFDLVWRRRNEQQQIQRFSKRFSISSDGAESVDDAREEDESMGTSGASRRLDPAALFGPGRGPRGAKSAAAAAAAAAHERSRQNRNQILGLLSDPAAAARSLDAAFTARVDSIVGAGNVDDDDGLSIALDADEYVQASTTNDRATRNEMLVASLSDNDDDNAGWPIDDETGMNDWAVDLDPAYRAVLETLVNVPNSNPTNRDTVRAEQQIGLSTATDGGKATVEDLVRILEAQQKAPMSDAQRTAMMPLGNGATAAADNESAAEQIHHLVFENEEGFWNQSDAFRKGLTDPANRGAMRQVLADRRSALFEERNRASLHRLEDQLDQLQRSIDVPASDPKSASANRCPRCRSVLTEQDVELMRRRDTRLCPVCTAEVRLVSRNPTGATTTTTPAFASRVPFRSNVAAPASALRDSRLGGNRRVYRTSREQRPPPPQTLARIPHPPEPQQPFSDSEAPPARPEPPSESSTSSSRSTSPFRQE
jgi:hypothetical protein